jgi:hypothetical protein
VGNQKKKIFHFSFVIAGTHWLKTGEQALQQTRRRLETRRLESGLVRPLAAGHKCPI